MKGFNEGALTAYLTHLFYVEEENFKKNQEISISSEDSFITVIISKLTMHSVIYKLLQKNIDH